MNRLSTEDAEELTEKIYNAIQTAPRRMREHEIEEAVTMAYKRALGIPVEVELVKQYPDDERPKPIRVFSIGATPHDAIIDFFTEVQGAEKVVVRDELPKGNNEKDFPWGFYVTVDGTGCKAAGTYISGFAVLTWWK